MKLAGSCAVIEVEEIELVTICWLFTCTVELLRKFVPVMTRFVVPVAEGFAAIDDGIMLWIAGIGVPVMIIWVPADTLALGGGLLIVNSPVPKYCRSLLVNATCRLVGLPNVVVRGDPFQSPTELVSNPVPVTITVVAVP